MFVCFASVFCASGRTMILPLNTPRERAVQDALVELAAGACGFAWSIVVWLSRCCVPRPRKRPFSAPSAPSPASTVEMSVRASEAPRETLFETSRAERATRPARKCTWHADSLSRWRSVCSNDAPGPTSISVTPFVR